ncbi:type VII secretion-associated serine protease mycosin [Mycobacterium sp. CPCC 205372]|uniref:Type VII secretion-associated serine protease mycosin n=1 Tax=Mycobacterium hippophais TaxID=3016340 RepID=A0ABT4PUD3_9MYCO|nr:type VII secretion-associated serine protease mycosin [Mycobacterium hippophais]MCZ8380189.1 type VII secretion-associated serine protease mycosin [Mycobacterium hippophais]
MTWRWAARSTMCLAAAAALTCGPATAPAAAVEPPAVPPGPPPAGPVAPPDPTEQKTVCAVPGVRPGTDFTIAPVAAQMLRYQDAWAYSRGAGQKIAVIDTGVNRNARLPALEPGGDYVSGTDGLSDCDAHGTLVAGILAAQPSPDDAFAGVAPDAAILSIRQNSLSFAVKGGSAQWDPNAVSSGAGPAGYGSTRTLALAVVRAVDLGATVLNLSELACAPVSVGIDDAELGRAVRYAFERNVVVVAAAGNVDERGACRVQNVSADPNLPAETAWSTVQTLASPAWFDDYVLTVGALSPHGEPSDFSLRGPWVDVAAPGEHAVSLSPDGVGLVNGIQGQQGLAPVNGTSYAAPYVAGLAALVRARFPELTAAQVMERIERTARTPESGPNIATGHGAIDPVAALTATLPGEPAARGAGTPIAPPPAPDPASTAARDTAFAVAGACVAAMVFGGAMTAAYRRRNTLPRNES